jgi:hypothetical protein
MTFAEARQEIIARAWKTGGSRMTNPWTILDGFGGEGTIAVRPALIRLFGASAAILLAQLLYWQRQKDDGDQWVWNNQVKLEEQTGLSADVQRTARAALVAAGVLEEQRAGIPAKLFYHVILSALVTTLEAGPKQASSTRGQGGRFVAPTDEKPDKHQLSGIPTSRNREPREQDHGNPDAKTTAIPIASSPVTPISLRNKIPSKTPTKTPTSAPEVEIESDLEPPGDVDDVQNPVQGQNPTLARSSFVSRLAPPATFGRSNPQPKPMPSQAQDGITRSGLEDSPGGGMVTPRAQAGLDLHRILSAPHNQEHRQHIITWLNMHPLEYIQAVIAEVESGANVKSSGAGFAITALNSPGGGSVPEYLRTGLKRLHAGLPLTLERRRGWYKLANNRHEHIERWDADGIAHTLETKFAPAMTRMWERLPDGWTPDDHLEQPTESQTKPDDADRARVAALAADFLNKRKAAQAVTGTP